MPIKVKLYIAMLIASGSAIANESLLEDAVKRSAVESVKASAPNTVQKIEAANQNLEKAKALKESAEQAPAAISNKADATRKKAAEKLKVKIKEAPEAAKRQAITKSLDLLK